MATCEWILKKNCSITPRQLLKAYAALCGASFLVALYFLLHGAWVVMVFAVLEMTAVAAAFLYAGRHATDSERIVLSEAELTVELVWAESVRQYRMNPWHTRIVMPVMKHGLIGLEAHGDRVEVGRFLTERKRQAFAKELRQELVSYQSGT